MHFLENNPGRIAMVNGQEFLFFSGYSYLDMEHEAGFIQNVNGGIEKYGLLFPSSRISNTRLALYVDFERILSGIHGTEETVSFSSGFLAGRAISSLLSERKNLFVAPATHPAVSLGNEHATTGFEEWCRELTTKINDGNIRDCTLIFDAVNIMQGKLNYPDFLKIINGSVSITCLVDISHLTGLLDENSFRSYFPREKHIEYIFSYSLSKAWHIEGGAVSCSAAVANELRSRSEYAGSTAISPASAYAFMQSRELYDAQRIKLSKNISAFNEMIADLSFIFHEDDLPIYIIHISGVEEMLFEKGIIISSFAYPDAASAKVNRVILNAGHEEGDLRRLAEAIRML